MENFTGSSPNEQIIDRVTSLNWGYTTDSFVFTLSHCKVMRFESTGFNRIVTDKLHRVKAGSQGAICSMRLF